MKSPRPALFPTGFALVSVLALVSLAALTATAFLASARLERQATFSLGSKTQMEMALNAGRECARQTLNDYTQPKYLGNTHIVTYWRTNWIDELGYPFIAEIKVSGANYGQASAAWYYRPLFSPAGMTRLDTNSIQDAMRFTNNYQGSFQSDVLSFMAGATNSFTQTPDPTNPICTQIPLLAGRTSPPVGWVYIYQEKRKLGSNQTNSLPVIRFAWFTEDLDGLIDAERMGSSTTRDSGTNPAEISLADARGPYGAIVPSNSVSIFTNNAKLFLSPSLLANSNISGLTNTNDARYFASGLRSWSPTTANSGGALAWIPVGIPISGSNPPKGYTNQGFTKINLNRLTNTNDISAIVAAISNNLPNFKNRAGAMDGATYLSNIAANIVDYVDADSVPSVDPAIATNATDATKATWRGVEAIAWPNEVFTRFKLINRNRNGSDYEFKLELKHYIEVWNLCSLSVRVDGASYSISNNLDIPLKCENWTGNLKSADSSTPPMFELCTNTPFTIPPNAYGVIATDTRVFTITTSNVSTANTNPSLTINPTTETNKYAISYSNKIIDATPGGRWLGNATNMKVGDFHFISTAVNFGTSTNNSTFNLASGDPRGGLFVKLPAMDFAYKYTTPGGRNVDNNPRTIGGAKYVDPSTNWADGGHSLGKNGADIVTPPTSANDNNSIAQGLQKEGNTNHYVQKMNNSGSFTNIMELGNIFDPIQWGDPDNPFHPLDSASWMNLTTNAKITNFPGSCGRNTLRIGRPEHARFAFTNFGGNSFAIPNMGMSAVALLDLFCIINGTNIGSGGPFSTGGKINLNTAPPPVLRALAGSIILTNDPAIALTNGATVASATPAMAEAFAQGVMRFRSKYPFLTPSHLNFIGTDSNWPNMSNWPANAVFGNTNSIALDTTVPGNTNSVAKINVSEWNDQAAEEWFSKVWALSSCQSYNFRVYVVAQMVNSNRMPVGPVMRKYYQMYARNGSSVGTNPIGANYNNATITNWTPTVNIIKTYESPY